MLSLLVYLAPAAGAAMILLAQTKIREKSPDAALRMSIAGGLVALQVVPHFVASELIFTLEPVLFTAAACLASWSLLLLGDALNPVQGKTLPNAIGALRTQPVGAGLGPRIVFAVFVLIAIGVTGANFGMDPTTRATSALAAVGVIFFGYIVAQRGNWAVWVLERRPEWVVWVYPSKLTVVSQRYGTRNVYWRSIVGLRSGLRLLLPAGSEAGAASLSAEVASVCPDASLGHTPELEAKFRSNPESMRRSAAPRI